MGKICVNRSGRTLQVTRTNGGSDYIGTIAPNEVFAWTNSHPANDAAGSDYQGVYCHGIYGWVNGYSGTGAFTPIQDCALYNINLEDKDGGVFMLRRDTYLYDSDGHYAGFVGAGHYCFTSTSTCGHSNPNYLYIDAYGQYEPEHMAGYFLDLKLNRYSHFSNCTVIGNI